MHADVDPEERIAAPGDLELVRAFANTLRVEDDRDELATSQELKRWLQSHLGMSRRVPVGQGVHRLALRLRHALRGLMAVNSGEALPADIPTELNRLIAQLKVELEWDTSGALRIDSGRSGPEHELGRLLGFVTTAAAEGRWARLKLCRNLECRWAFYDQSRSRTGRWCDMAVCGRRINQRRYRRRKNLGAAR
jgi:predicted RNA-binding Zn ribbon-like protein